MNLELFCVYDAKAESFLPPFDMLTRGQAMRAFADQVNKQDSNFNRHAADYTLFHVGSFDQLKGELKPLVPPVALANALTVREEASS